MFSGKVCQPRYAENDIAVNKAYMTSVMKLLDSEGVISQTPKP